MTDAFLHFHSVPTTRLYPVAQNIPLGSNADMFLRGSPAGQNAFMLSQTEHHSAVLNQPCKLKSHLRYEYLFEHKMSGDSSHVTCEAQVVGNFLAKVGWQLDGSDHSEVLAEILLSPLSLLCAVLPVPNGGL